VATRRAGRVAAAVLLALLGGLLGELGLLFLILLLLTLLLLLLLLLVLLELLLVFCADGRGLGDLVVERRRDLAFVTLILQAHTRATWVSSRQRERERESRRVSIQSREWYVVDEREQLDRPQIRDR